MNSNRRPIWATLALSAAFAAGCGGSNTSSFQQGSGFNNGQDLSDRGGMANQMGAGGTAVTFYGLDKQILLLKDGDGPWIKLETRQSSTYPDVPYESSANIRDSKGRYSLAVLGEKKIQILETTVQEAPVATFCDLRPNHPEISLTGKISGYEPKDDRLKLYTNLGPQAANAKKWTAKEGSELFLQSEPAKVAATDPSYPVSAKGLRLGPFADAKSGAAIAADLAGGFDYVPYTVKGTSSLVARWETSSDAVEMLPSGARGEDSVYLGPPAAQVKTGDRFTFWASHPVKVNAGQTSTTSVAWWASAAGAQTAPKYPDAVEVDEARVEKAENGQYRFKFMPKPGYNVFHFDSAEISGDRPRSFEFTVTKGRLGSEKGGVTYVTPSLKNLPAGNGTTFSADKVDFDFSAVGTAFPHVLDGFALAAQDNSMPASSNAPDLTGYAKGTWCIRSTAKVTASK